VSGRRPRSLTPHVFVRDADAAVAFYRDAFGAAELLRTTLPDGRVLFVELALGDGRLLVSEETPSLGALAPPTIGGSPVLLTLQLDDVDGVTRRALRAGAEVEMPVREMFSVSATASSATPSVTVGRSPPPVSSSLLTRSPAAARPRCSRVPGRLRLLQCPPTGSAKVQSFAQLKLPVAGAAVRLPGHADASFPPGAARPVPGSAARLLHPPRRCAVGVGRRAAVRPGGPVAAAHEPGAALPAAGAAPAPR
jgi:uncharacterized glyoxalase superfamily protein PhnB